MPMTVPVMRVRPEVDRDLGLPRAMSEGAAGIDLPAGVASPVTLAPGERRVIPTGFAVAIPAGYEGQVRPRSGLAAQRGVTLLNSPGTIDADYRGEVQVIVINHGSEPFVIERGMRIAQLVVTAVTPVAVTETDRLPETSRGAGGFGSTGTK